MSTFIALHQIFEYFKLFFCSLLILPAVRDWLLNFFYILKLRRSEKYLLRSFLALKNLINIISDWFTALYFYSTFKCSSGRFSNRYIYKVVDLVRRKYCWFHI
jgi:hypothetical protein